jgi:hypothetical protein
MDVENRKLELDGVELKDDFLDPYELESVPALFYELPTDERPLQIGPGNDGEVVVSEMRGGVKILGEQVS